LPGAFDILIFGSASELLFALGFFVDSQSSHIVDVVGEVGVHEHAYAMGNFFSQNSNPVRTWLNDCTATDNSQPPVRKKGRVRFLM